MFDRTHDARVRSAAFEWLADQVILKHAIQGLHGARIQLPRRQELRPDTGLLSKRYEQYRNAASGYAP